MEQIKQNWLPILLEAIHGSTAVNQRESLDSERLNVHNLIFNKHCLLPCQKLLLSATLTRNPEKLEQMQLFQPVYFSIGAQKLSHETDQEAQSSTTDQQRHVESKEVKMLSEMVSSMKKVDESGSNIHVPKELCELFVELLLTEKPLMAIYLLKSLGYRRMLCFVKSKDTAKRLTKLFELNGIKALEYSSALHGSRRKRAQTRFEEDKLDVLVCSDVMARGMDLANVDYVLLYDAPKDLSSYVHKVGRTARAGRAGTAITFLEKKEVYFFKKMSKQIGSSSTEAPQKQQHKIKEIKIKKSDLKALIADYRKSLSGLKEALRKTSSFKEKTKVITNGTHVSRKEESENTQLKKRKHSNNTNSKYLKRIKK